MSKRFSIANPPGNSLPAELSSMLTANFRFLPVHDTVVTCNEPRTPKNRLSEIHVFSHSCYYWYSIRH